jgi:hypothetical protein
MMIFLAASGLAGYLFFGEGTAEAALGLLGLLIAVKVFQAWWQFRKRNKQS